MDYYQSFKGITQKKVYDEKTSLSLAVACKLAYEEKTDTISKTVSDWGYEFVGFNSIVKKPDIDTQYYVMSNDENIVVVMRGSNDLKDWFSNFQAVYDPGPFRRTKVHEGFQDALFPAVISLTNMVDSADFKNKKLWITGHSLGGALCSIYAGMLIENKYDVYGVYTFASPRPGNGAFASRLNKRVSGPHYRVVNTGDIVPHVPPEPFYSHSGKRIILKADGKDKSADTWFEQRIDALKIFIAKTARGLDIVGNHSLTEDDLSYIPRLVEDLEREEG